jgi:hypothetical protein
MHGFRLLSFVTTVLSVVCLLPGGALHAQDLPDDFQSPAYQSQLDPAWGVTPTTSKAEPRYSAFASFDVGVPLMLDVDRDLVRPGANLHAQGGLDFNYLSVFLHGGWRWVPVDFDRAADHGANTYGQTGRTPLKNPYFGLGVRAQIPNASIFLPYASMAFDFNFWNFRETAVSCGGYYYWWCSGYDVYRFTPGFSWRVGTGIEVAQSIYIDTGLGISLSFEGQFFDQTHSWLEPYLGLLHRF